jgi:hypothetical protein
VVLLSDRLLNVRSGTAAAECARAGVRARVRAAAVALRPRPCPSFASGGGLRRLSYLVDLIRRDSARTLSSDDVRVRSRRGFLLGLDRWRPNTTLRRIRSLVARLSSFAVTSFFTLVCRVYSPRSATAVHQLCREGNERNGGRTSFVSGPFCEDPHKKRPRACRPAERADCWAWPSSSSSSSWSSGRTDAPWTGPDVQDRPRNASSASGAA